MGGKGVRAVNALSQGGRTFWALDFFARKKKIPARLQGPTGLGGGAVGVCRALRFYRKYFPAFAPRIIRSTPRNRANSEMNSASISGI